MSIIGMRAQRVVHEDVSKVEDLEIAKSKALRVARDFIRWKIYPKSIREDIRNATTSGEVTEIMRNARLKYL